MAEQFPAIVLRNAAGTFTAPWVSAHLLTWANAAPADGWTEDESMVVTVLACYCFFCLFVCFCFSTIRSTRVWHTGLKSLTCALSLSLSCESSPCVENSKGAISSTFHPGRLPSESCVYTAFAPTYSTTLTHSSLPGLGGNLQPLFCYRSTSSASIQPVADACVCLFGKAACV